MDQWCCQSSPEAALYGRVCQQMPFPSFIFARIFPNFFLTPSRILESNFFYNKSALGFADLSTVFDLAFFNALVRTFLSHRIFWIALVGLLVDVVINLFVDKHVLKTRFSLNNWIFY